MATRLVNTVPGGLLYCTGIGCLAGWAGRGVTSGLDRMVAGKDMWRLPNGSNTGWRWAALKLLPLDG